MSTPPCTNEALADEIVATNSIYAPDTLAPSSASEPHIFTLRIPSFPSVTLRVEFPDQYPDVPPAILGTHSVGDDVAKGVGNRVVDLVRGVLGDVYVPGEPCIFALLEEVREAVENSPDLHTSHDDDEGASETVPSTSTSTLPAAQQTEIDLGPPPPWTLAPPLTEKKSIFLARVAPVSSPAQAQSYLAQLLATDKKVAKATHNITAWRIRGQGETTYQDCDDDGETAAGGRVLHLMQVMDVWDVMVVVTRWYGGVLLGPDRFRIIGSVARDALVIGGFAKEGRKGRK